MAASELRSVVVASGFDSAPLEVTAPTGDTERLFVVLQNGKIALWKRGSAATTWTTFLDIEDQVRPGGEQGLLSLVFDPNYATNGYFYVNYIDDADRNTVVSRFSVSAADPDLADASTEVELLRFSQPSSNHNGGQLAFASDGFLYVSTGDGGGSNDNHGSCGNGQNLSTLLGGILRIDPQAQSGSAPDCSNGAYTIPGDNPFRDGSGGDCDELWAYGLRNPWRFDIDPLTDDMYIADVGQRCWEEVNYVPGSSSGGRNYGWRSMEGSACFNPATAANCSSSAVSCGTNTACNDPSLTLPIVEYAHSSGRCSITGGKVYRGCRLEGYDGAYLYGDFCSGQVYSFRVENGSAIDQVERSDQIDPTNRLLGGLTGFGRDGQGEIYLTDQSGEIVKIVPPFAETEVSGVGANMLLHGPGGWLWEDVPYTTMVPVEYYQVYRGALGQSLSCVHSSSIASWSADATSPAPGELLSYVVTAVDSSGDETLAGGSGRTLIAPCGAP